MKRCYSLVIHVSYVENIGSSRFNPALSCKSCVTDTDNGQVTWVPHILTWAKCAALHTVFRSPTGTWWRFGVGTIWAHFLYSPHSLHGKSKFWWGHLQSKQQPWLLLFTNTIGGARCGQWRKHREVDKNRLFEADTCLSVWCWVMRWISWGCWRHN